MHPARLMALLGAAAFAPSSHDLARAEATQPRQVRITHGDGSVTIRTESRSARHESRRRAHAKKRRCTWGPNAWKRPAHIEV